MIESRAMKFDDLPQCDDYASLFLNNIPMLDVRAPVEFKQGAFPATRNMPLMDDEDRHKIGIEFKEQGQNAAIDLGLERVSGDVKAGRVNNWKTFTEQHPQGVLYCFRGGMRSKISQQWIYDATGVQYPRVKGGYKAMRRFLMDYIEDSTQHIRPILLGGRTGTGKTVLLQTLEQQVDLEGIYHHRGSVFGIHATPQPTQINAENTLAIKLLKLRHRNIDHIVFEDESANIGSRRIPESLYDVMKQAPIVLLDATPEERVDVTFDEYITNTLREYQAIHGHEKGFRLWSEYLLGAIDRIHRRLGGVRHQQLRATMTQAIHRHQTQGDTALHRQWIRSLLIDYYDPMYDYQLSKKQDRVVFKGSPDTIRDYLSATYNIA